MVLEKTHQEYATSFIRSYTTFKHNSDAEHGKHFDYLARNSRHNVRIGLGSSYVREGTFELNLTRFRI